LELSEATTLTALHFDSSGVMVQGLSTLTRLQSLTLGGPQLCLSDRVTSNLRTQLQQALPQLQALTFLRLLGVVADDDVLQHVSNLPLRKLMLVNGIFTPASFQQLPQSLTSLSIDWMYSRATFTLCASTASGLRALTGLQVLTVHKGAIGVDLLATLTSLKNVNFYGPDDRLKGPGMLSALTALIQLTRLMLPPLDSALLAEVQADSRHAAAVTASTQLASLDIIKTGLPAATCRHLFTAGRQLLQLTELRATFELIRSGPEAALVAACCPNLAYIGFQVPPQLWPGVDIAGMLDHWHALQHLTSLTLNAGILGMGHEAWCAMGRLVQLRELQVCFALGCAIGRLQDILELGSLKQLVYLDLECTFTYPQVPGGPRYTYPNGISTQRLSFQITSNQVGAGGFGTGCHMLL
jgi:hypothetical protein